MGEEFEWAEDAVENPQPAPKDLPPEPGTVKDMDHGVPGDEEELPTGDANDEEGTEL